MTGVRVDSRVRIASKMAVEFMSATGVSTVLTTSGVSSGLAGSVIGEFIK